MNKQIHQSLIDRALAERQRQADLPGSEWDAKNTPGDWIALVNHYVGSEVRRNGIVPSSDAFEEAFVKALAVVFAAFEHIEVMKARDELL